MAVRQPWLADLDCSGSAFVSLQHRVGVVKEGYVLLCALLEQWSPAWEPCCLWEEERSKAPMDAEGLLWLFSEGNVYRHLLSQGKLFWEWFNSDCSQVFLLECHFCTGGKNLEHLYTHGFYWESSNSHSKNWIFVYACVGVALDYLVLWFTWIEVVKMLNLDGQPFIYSLFVLAGCGCRW